MNTILLIFILNCHFFILQAQVLEVNGTLTSCRDSLPIPFAHIVISEGDNFTGTITSAEGHFNLNIIADHLVDTLQASCIGYHTNRINVKEFLKSNAICLEEKPAQLKTVVISGISAKEYMMRVIDRISRNYHHKGISRGYYWNLTLEDGKWRDYKSVYCSFSNKFNDQITVDSTLLNTNLLSYEFPLLTDIDNIFYFDFIRNKTGALRPVNLDDWLFEFGVSEYPEVVVINAKSLDAMDHSYTIFVNHEDYAIRKMEYDLKWDSGKYFPIDKGITYTLRSVRGSCSYEKIGRGYKLKFTDFMIEATILKGNKYLLDFDYTSELSVTSFHTSSNEPRLDFQRPVRNKKVLEKFTN